MSRVMMDVVLAMNERILLSIQPGANTNGVLKPRKGI